MAFQTTSTEIGTMQEDIHKLLRSFLVNFIKHEPLHDAADILAICFNNRQLQLLDDELSIGTATQLMLIDAKENGSLQVEPKFFADVHLFYETTMKKIVIKFNSRIKP